MSTATQSPPAKKKRGTESVRDMLLSLAVTFALVLPFWYVASLDDDEGPRIRVVDTAQTVGQFQQAVPGAPVPAGLPERWRPTSANLDGTSVRIGYVTPADEYAEYAAQGGDAAAFLRRQTGKGEQVTRLQVEDRTFQVWSNEAGATSLVLQEPGWTVVVGGLRETAGDEELQALAASLQ